MIHYILTFILITFLWTILNVILIEGVFPKAWMDYLDKNVKHEWVFLVFPFASLFWLLFVFPMIENKWYQKYKLDRKINKLKKNGSDEVKIYDWNVTQKPIMNPYTMELTNEKTMTFKCRYTDKDLHELIGEQVHIVNGMLMEKLESIKEPYFFMSDKELQLMTLNCKLDDISKIGERK